MGNAGDYEYIIVGAGSAGCVLANRLSADPGNRVLLLEAGPRDTNPWIHLPGGYYKLIYHPTLSWNFKTASESTLLGREMIWPRGRVLGGSSSINAMVYIRGQSQDFDMWRQRGCVGWGFRDVLPYFLRAEDQQRGADALHGVGGPLAVCDLIDSHPLSDAFIAAAEEYGLPRNNDFNGVSQEGTGYFQFTARNKRRCSTAVGYLRPAEKRPNLRVETDMLATRIMFDGRRAVGIVTRQGDSERSYQCNKELILSAGAIKSPHLLLLSGVGPAAHLKAFGIDPLHHLPGVGGDLQDHLQTKLIYRVEGVESYNQIRRSPFLMLREGLRFALGRRGVLASGPSMAGGFARTNSALDLPDMQLHFNPVSGDRPGHFHDFPGCTPIASQLRPESRGHLGLRSPDPFEQPEMRANYLATETDRRVTVEGVKICRQIMAQPAMQRYRAVEVSPGPQVTTNDELLGYAREAGYTQFHPTCTCRMGRDAMAVVDPELKVIGLSGLRVVDASIMPAVVSGNTNATTIMIAEKAADMILGKAVEAAAA